MIFGNLDNGITNVTTNFENLKRVLLYDFGALYKKNNISLSGLSGKEIESLQEYINALNSGTKPAEAMNEIMGETSELAQTQATRFTYLHQQYQRGEISANQYNTATQNLAQTQRIATTTSKALSSALNMLVNAGIIIAINVAIKAISSLVDKLILTEEELDEVRNKTSQTLDILRSNTEAFVEEGKKISELVSEYKTIIDSVDGTEEAKSDLLSIQEELIKQFDLEAQGLDLINGKYDDNIEKIKEYSKEKQKEFERENAAAIAEAKRISEYNVLYAAATGDVLGRDNLNFGDYQLLYKGQDELAESLYKIEGVSNDILEIYKEIEGVGLDLGINSSDLYLSGDINEAKEQVGQLLDAYKKLNNYDGETWKKLNDRYNLLKKKIEDIDFYLNTFSSKGVIANVADVVANTFSRITNVVAVSSEEMKSNFLKKLDEMQKGSLKNISTMVSALQDLSEGKGIAANTFWQLIEFDEEGLLNGAQLIGDKFYVAQENMIKLKDQYIQKQIESIEKDKDAAKELYIYWQREIAIYEQKLRELPLTDKINNTTAYQRINEQLEIARANAQAYGDDWERNNQLIQYLNQSLGNTIDLQKQLEAQQKQLNKELTTLNKELDNYQKAYEAKIDGIIKDLEAEEDELEKQLDTLENELDVLEKQKDTIEETLDSYEKVNSYVQKIIDKEIESLEEQRDAIKDTYNERIDALKAENEEREDALDYAQKLANLENAKNNKRRVYDEARGWRYESVKEDVVKAENDLKTFETNQEVKKLEKERDAEIKAWDALIKQKEEYKKHWTEWLEEIQDEESETLAQEILGAEWREKIAEGDLQLIETFSAQYRAHNTELQRLTDTEIKLKNAEIEAKKEDIKASKERIQAWKTYKQEFSTAVNDIKQANEDYMKNIGEIKLNEKSNLEERATEFEKFKNKVTGLVDQIGQKQTAIDEITSSLDELQDKNIQISFEIENMDLIREARQALREISENSTKVKVLTAAEIFSLMAQSGAVNAPQGEQMAALLQYLKEGFSQGGVASHTGIAMLHGSKNAPETIFNATDSAKLYEFVHDTPNLMAETWKQAARLSGFKLTSNENSNNKTVSIGSINVFANNPTELANGLDKHLDRYFRTRLTQSYTSRQ